MKMNSQRPDQHQGLNMDMLLNKVVRQTKKIKAQEDQLVEYHQEVERLAASLNDVSQAYRIVCQESETLKKEHAELRRENENKNAIIQDLRAQLDAKLETPSVPLVKEATAKRKQSTDSQPTAKVLTRRANIASENVTYTKDTQSLLELKYQKLLEKSEGREKQIVANQNEIESLKRTSRRRHPDFITTELLEEQLCAYQKSLDEIENKRYPHNEAIDKLQEQNHRLRSCLNQQNDAMRDLQLMLSNEKDKSSKLQATFAKIAMLAGSLEDDTSDAPRVLQRLEGQKLRLSSLEILAIKQTQLLEKAMKERDEVDKIFGNPEASLPEVLRRLRSHQDKPILHRLGPFLKQVSDRFERLQRELEILKQENLDAMRMICDALYSCYASLEIPSSRRAEPRSILDAAEALGRLSVQCADESFL